MKNKKQDAISEPMVTENIIEQPTDPEITRLVELRQSLKSETEALRATKQSIENEVSTLNKERDGMKKELSDMRKAAEQSIEAERKIILKDAREEAILITKNSKDAAREQSEIHKIETSRLRDVEKELNSREHQIIKSAQKLSERETNASSEFQKELSVETESCNKIIAILNADIEKLKIEKLKAEAAVVSGLQPYREQQMQIIDAEVKAVLNSAKSKETECEKLLQANIEKGNEIESLRNNLEIAKKSNEMEAGQYKASLANLDKIATEKAESKITATMIENEELKQRNQKLQEDYKEILDKNAKMIKRFNDFKSDKPDRKGIDIDQVFDEKDLLKKENENLSIRLDKLINSNASDADIQEWKSKAKAYDKLEEKNSKLKIENEDLKRQAAHWANNDERLDETLSALEITKEDKKKLKAELDAKTIITRDQRMSSITNKITDFTELSSTPAFEKNLPEIEWLLHIRKKSLESGIIFPERLWNAYHTALKIGEMSPLVVLAGVSGTGKSEMPRQYAQHGGMHFMAVPVKPDWDSPSSLFGFYNSIENKFDATELLKALYQMQTKVDKKLGKQMLMVLLDEMNLAHIELYFSDLLSKFETKRGLGIGASIDIDLGAGVVPERLLIENNVLWTGTMNEDETTKTLSDKVVDRSTLIAFPRPEILIGRKAKQKIEKPDFVLERTTWDYWLNSAVVDLDNDVMEQKQKIVQDINGEMSRFGRNLGHRVWQGIQSYIANHASVIAANKSELEPAINTAFSEAVAFKIMPKLRGIEVKGDYEKHIENIRSIIANNATDLLEDYNLATSLPTGIFQWHSAKFLD